MSARLDWLRWRQGGLGGSDVAAILGLSPWAGPWSVWLSKTQPIEDGTDSAAMATGRRLEAAVLDWMADDIGGERLPEPDRAEGAESWMRATADGMIRAGGERQGLEAKTSRDEPWSAPPLYYETQCRWYMAVYQLQTWHLGCYFKRSDAWERWTLTRDPAVEDAMVERCRAWWKRHIIEGERPDVDASKACRRWQHEAHPAPGEDWGDATESTAAAAARYAQLGQELARIEVEREVEAAKLREAIGDAQGIRGRGTRVKWSRWTTRRLDTRALRKAHPDIAAAHETETPSGRLTVHIEGE